MTLRRKGFRLLGDVDYDAVAPKCSFITPVPVVWSNDQSCTHDEYDESNRIVLNRLKDITTSQSYSSADVRNGFMVPLMENFIRSRRARIRKSSLFARIGGCDVGCHWCDVKESWNPDTHPPTPISTLSPMPRSIAILLLLRVVNRLHGT